MERVIKLILETLNREKNRKYLKRLALFRSRDEKWLQEEIFSSLSQAKFISDLKKEKNYKKTFMGAF